MLVVDLVKGNAQSLVCLVEAIEYPAVHHRPEFTDLTVALLPFDEHLVHGFHTRGFFLSLLGIHSSGNEFLHLAGQDVVELYIAVSDEMVTLLAGALGGGSREGLLPSIHRFADVDSPVVDEGRLDHVVAAGLEKARHGVTQEIVADVTEMEGFISVGRGELDHDILPC